MPAELSGGMARRVALARAIVMDPELLVYDEPFVGLDPISMGVVLRLIRRLNDTLGVSSIVVSHDVREITAVADHCHLLSGGPDHRERAARGRWPAASTRTCASSCTGCRTGRCRSTTRRRTTPSRRGR